MGNDNNNNNNAYLSIDETLKSDNVLSKTIFLSLTKMTNVIIMTTQNVTQLLAFLSN